MYIDVGSYIRNRLTNFQPDHEGIHTMTAETLATGTRVAMTTDPATRGTVVGYTGSSMAVRPDAGGMHTAPTRHRTWRELTTDELAEEAQPAEPTTGAEPCTCPAGYELASDCPNCRANLALRAMGQPHGYRAPGSFAVCASCGFTNLKHSAGCPTQVKRPTATGQLVRNERGHFGITTSTYARTPDVAVQFIGASYPVRYPIADLVRVDSIPAAPGAGAL